MKKTIFSRGLVLLVILALALITAGIFLGFQSFSRMETLAWNHEDHQALADAFRDITIQVLIFGNMVMLGVWILVISLLHQMRRTSRIQKEVNVLQKRNDTIQELNGKLQQLAHHQRLETIGRLTASIAHEFNNLLTPIMGYSLMALEKVPPEEEELCDNLVEIYQSSRKAKEIISRLNDLSRKNTENCFREISPDELVRRTLSVCNPAKPEGVEVRLDLNCWDQRIQANEIQLSQLLLNLILNGFHAMGESGVLTISTTFDEKNVHIQVRDTGCGISKEDMHHIFEPFFTTKESGKGTGLGLAIAAQTVEDHKGTIRAESKVGEGTTFFVALPR